MTPAGWDGAADRLSMPAGWFKAERGYALPIAVVSAILFVTIVIVALLNRRYEVAITFGVALGLVATAVLVTRRRARNGRIDTATLELDGVVDIGLRIPIAATPMFNNIAAFILGVVLIGAGLFALGFVFARGEARGLIAAPILTGLGAIFFLSGLGGLKTRDPARGLYLTPTRVVMAPSRERAAFFWTQISAIRAIQIEYKIGRGLLHPIQNVLGLAVHDPDAMSELARVRRSRIYRWLAGDVGAAMLTRRLDVDPLLAYHALGHYLAHAEHRSELSTEAAVTRVYEGQMSGPAQTPD